MIKNRRLEETSELLFFIGITGKGESVTDARKNEAGDAAVEGLKENEFAISEVESGIGLMNLDAILGGDEVDGLSIEAKRVEGSKDIARGIRGVSAERQQGKKEDEDAAKAHDGV